MQLLKPYFEDFLCLLYDAQILDGFTILRCRNINARFGRQNVNWELAQVSESHEDQYENRLVLHDRARHFGSPTVAGRDLK